MDQRPFRHPSPSLALLLVLLFVLLFGHAAGKFDYLNEFAHDGGHLLAVPWH